MRQKLRFFRFFMIVSILIVMGLLFIGGCASFSPAPPRYYAYLDYPAVAHLVGTVDGIPVAFSLSFSPVARQEGSSARPLPQFSLTYQMPESLQGITVLYDAATGTTTAQLDEICIPGDFHGLCTATRLLLTENVILSTEKEARGIVLITENARLIIREGSGEPIALTSTAEGRVIDLSIDEWHVKKKDAS